MSSVNSTVVPGSSRMRGLYLASTALVGFSIRPLDRPSVLHLASSAAMIAARIGRLLGLAIESSASLLARLNPSRPARVRKIRPAARIGRRRLAMLAAAALGSLAIAPAAQAQSIWGGPGSTPTTSNYGDGNNWSTNPAAPIGGGTSAVFGGAGPNTVTVGSGVTTDSWSISGPNSYSISGGSVTFLTAAGLTNTSSANQTIGTTLGGGTATVTQNGSGTLTLTGANTYGGGTTVSAGRLVAQNTGSAFGSGTVTISSGAVVELNNTGGPFGLAGGTFTGAGTIQKTGTGNIYLGNFGVVNISLLQGGVFDVQAGSVSGSASGQGSWTNNKGSLNIASGAMFDGVEGAIIVDALTGAGTLKGGYGSQGGTTVGIANGNGTFSGTITDGNGPLVLIKVGTGTQTLTGANTYSGSTTISGGTLQVNSSAALGDGSATNTLIFNGGTLQAIGAIASPATRGVTLTGNGTIDTNGNAVSIAGIVTGAGNLSKFGDGTLTLTGANTYSGGTTVSGGTLEISDGGKVLNSGQAVVGNVANTSATLLVTGSGAQFINGSGMTLAAGMASGATGTVQATGGGQISVGYLGLGGAAGSTGQVLVDGTGSKLTVSNDLHVGQSGIGTMTVSNGATVVSNNQATVGSYGGGTGTVTVTGTGSSWSGFTTIEVGATSSGSPTASNGTLNISNGGYVGSTRASYHAYVGNGTNATTGARDVGVVNVDGANSTFDAGPYYLFVGASGGDGTITLSNAGTVKAARIFLGYGSGALGTLNIGAASGQTAAAAGTVQATNGIWFGSDTGQIVFNHTNTAYNFSTAIVGAGSIRQEAGTTSLTGDNSNYSGTTTIAGGVLAAQSSVALGNGSSSNALIFNGGTLRADGTIASPDTRGVTLAGNGTIDTNGNAVSIAGIIAGAGNLTSAGAGTLTLTGANTYSGSTTISGGTLQANASTALGDGSATNTLIFDGGTLQAIGAIASPATRGVTLTGNGTIDTNGNAVSIGGIVTGAGSLTSAGAGTLTLTGANTYTGGTSLYGGSKTIAGTDTAIGSAAVYGYSNATLGLQNGVTLANGLIIDGAFNLSVASGSATYSGQISEFSDPATLVKTGAGTLVVSNATNDFSGGARINEGTLQITADRALRTGTITLNGGVLQAGANVAPTNLTIDLVAPASTIDTNGFTVTHAGTIQNADPAAVLTKTGLGTLRLTGTQNTYAAVTVNDGVLQGGATNAFSPVGNVTILTNGTVDLGGFNQKVAALAGDATGVVTNSANGTATLTTDTATSSTFAGVFQDGAGTINLTKAGTGTLTLTGSNSTGNQFTGTANVNGGILAVNGVFGDTAGNSATVNVNSGGTLHGSGTIAGSVVVANGGTVSAGNSPGTLTVNGGYTLNTGSTSLFELGAPGVVGGASNDLINVGGNLTLAGTLSLVSASNAATAPVSGAYRLFNYGGTLAGGFDAVSTSSPGTSAIVYTNIPTQVNALVTNGNQSVQFFDGADMTGATQGGQGGTGTWNAAGTNWTTLPGGQVNDVWRSGVGIFGGTAGTVTVAGAQNLQGLQFTVDGYQLAGTGTLNLTGDPFTTANQSFVNVDANVGATIANALTSTGGSVGLVKLGDGTLTLTGASTYTGATTVQAGTLAIAAGGSITSSVTNAATFTNAGSVAGSLTNSGTASNAGTVSGGLTNTAGTTTNTGIINGGATILAGTFNTNATTSVVNGAVSNSGTVNAQGQINGSVANTAGAVFTVVGGLTGIGRFTNDGSLALSGNSLSVGSLAGSTAAASIAGGGTLSAGSDNTSSGYAGTIAGATALTKQGSGTLTLSGANTYTGATTIAAGTLQAGAANAFSSGSAVTVASSSRMDLNGFNQSVASLSGAGSVTLGAGTLTTGGSNASTSYAGVISGTGGLTKTGTGSFTLSGANSYTGLTTVTGGTLALTSSGSLAGGVNNAATFTSAGSVAGGLTNTGTVTASAGRIDGAIANKAGSFTVSGNVASNGTFANASGATLTVTGSGTYGLGGLLTNAGSLTVASGGKLTAPAGITNSGAITVAQGGTVVDALVNTGSVTNNGTYTADVTNAASGSITNTGIWSTVTAPFANAGSLTTTGTLNGGLANTGTVQASGQLNGAVSNASGASLTLTGALTGVTSLANNGTVDLGGTAFTVGSLSGTGTAAVIRNGALTTGGDNSSTSYAGSIANGAAVTSLTKTGTGNLTLTGASTYTGATNVQAGTLTVEGSLASSVSLANGALLAGSGSAGGLTVASGSSVSPGSSAGAVGTLKVAGNVLFSNQSLYQVDATAFGQSDRITATGTATLQGGTVQVTAQAGAYNPSTSYTILSAAGGVTGRFSGVTSNFAYLTPFLTYDANDAYLRLARNDLQFASTAQTRNQAAVANAAEATGVGARLYDAIAVLSAPQSRVAFDALSGEIHASAVSTQFENAFLVREAVLDRLRWGNATGFGNDTLGIGQRFAPGTTLPAAYTADLPGRASAPTPVTALLVDPNPIAVWGQGFGSFGSTASDGNAARLARQTSGFVLGADARVENNWRLGAAGGYSFTNVDVTGRQSSGTIESGYGALYAGGPLGGPQSPLQLRLGATYGGNSLTTRRGIAFAGFNENAGARYGGTTAQGFAELGYRIGTGASYLEPFIGGAAIRIGRDRFTETGGASALTAQGRDYDLATSTIGLRAEARLSEVFATNLPIMVRALVGYRRAYGDVVPTALLAFAGGQQFVSAGLPIDRDALVAQAGLDWQMAPGTTLGVGYTGQVGPRAQDHGVKGNFTYRF